MMHVTVHSMYNSHKRCNPFVVESILTSPGILKRTSNQLLILFILSIDNINLETLSHTYTHNTLLHRYVTSTQECWWWEGMERKVKESAEIELIVIQGQPILLQLFCACISPPTFGNVNL